MSSHAARALGDTRSLATLGDWLAFAEKLYARENVALGPPTATTASGSVSRTTRTSARQVRRLLS